MRDNIYVSDKITSAAVYGVFRPKIIIPKGYELRYELQNSDYVLAHESAHIRRKDNLWRIIAVISASIHWFNPFAWILLKKFLEETELACDEQVLADCGKIRKAYATAHRLGRKGVFCPGIWRGKDTGAYCSHSLLAKAVSHFDNKLRSFAAAIGYVLLTNAS